MKILRAEQFRAWDEYTIREEPISSEKLMERAAFRCFTWIMEQYPQQEHFTICCGKGNNGGDGLAIARLLALRGRTLSVYILEFGHLGTPDFQLNLSHLHPFVKVTVRFIQTSDQLPIVQPHTLLIDALYGSGLSRGLEGLSAEVVTWMNQSGLPCIAIDLPSGLFADRSSLNYPVVQATHTLCLQAYKLAMLLPENEKFLGQLHLLPIGLHPGFYAHVETNFVYQLREDIQKLLPLRSRYAHKGDFGHALLIGGSVGKMGAAILAARGALRAGVGLLTCQIPAQGNVMMQTAVPEAMCHLDANSNYIADYPDNLFRFASVGIGPGLGLHPDTVLLLKTILVNYKRPLVIDADALNILAQEPELLTLLPAQSVLTPHPKEFDRMFGPSANDFDRMEKAIEKAHQHLVFIVLKGHHSLIVYPTGEVYFNGSGNPGMATGGMGDVLTGILTGLLAQGNLPVGSAVRLGVYLHGLAGNLAAQSLSEPALLPSDLIDHLGAAWTALEK